MYASPSAATRMISARMSSKKTMKMVIRWRGYRPNPRQRTPAPSPTAKEAIPTEALLRKASLGDSRGRLRMMPTIAAMDPAKRPTAIGGLPLGTVSSGIVRILPSPFRVGTGDSQYRHRNIMSHSNYTGLLRQNPKKGGLGRELWVRCPGLALTANGKLKDKTAAGARFAPYAVT